MTSAVSLPAVDRDDASLRDVVDPLGHQLHVVAHQRLVEVAADEGAFAPERIVGGEPGFQLRILDAIVDVAERQRLQPVGGVVVAAEGDGVLEGPIDLIAVLPGGPLAPGEALFVLVTERLVRAGQDPLRGALIHVDLLRHLGYLGNDLGRAGTRPDDGHLLATEIVLVLPARGVKAWTGEVLETLDVGVGRRRERPDGADQHVAGVGASLRIGQVPTMRRLVPSGCGDTRVGAEMRADPEPVGAILEVLQDLGLVRVGLRPVRLEGERIGVEVRGHVAGRPGVCVVPPRPADALRGLEDHEVTTPSLHHPDGQAEPTRSSAQDGDVPVFRLGRGSLRNRRAHPAPPVRVVRLARAAASISSTRTPLGSVTTTRRTGPSTATLGSPPTPSAVRRGRTTSKSA